MSRVIAGIYEIQEQIGAGGGGIVYLGRHLRLEKQIVLKADKRSLNKKPEALRREVDMLKGLSHTYIPQVYDFVQEEGTVYTVMDFIEGESLDKVLDRRQNLDQPMVIRWACQLLEALCYLHSRPPHGILHGDMKPANIMLRPNGDICLIDYNIALALGEDGAVKVGYSRGYASPEHYGSNDTGSLVTTALMANSTAINVDTTVAGEIMKVDGDMGIISMAQDMKETETMEQGGGGPSSGRSSTNGYHSVMLDVRSDIYSLGATLYHFLSGCRPAQNAYEVEPLGVDVCSPAVAAIIKKAMEPDPSMRYQTAQEMLTAFRQLYRRDRRVIRHKKRAAVSAVFLSVLFLAGGACTFTGLKQLEQRQNALALAEYSSNALAEGNISHAIELALQALPKERSILEAPVTAQARKALTDALGVYDLSEGFKSLDTVTLPAAPFGIVISPGGVYFAVVYQSEAAIYELESLQKLVVLPVRNSALSDLMFVDEKQIIYAGDKGITAYDLERQEMLWIGGPATILSLSGDRKTVAAVNKDEDYAVIYRMSDGAKLQECSFHNRKMTAAVNDIFANPNNHIFSLNKDGSMLAVSFSDGGLRIFDLENPDQDQIIYEESEYRHFEGGFCGEYFAFTAGKSDQSLFGLIDTKEALYIGGYESRNPFSIKADETGIYLANGNLLVRFDPDTLEETELAYTDQENITGFSVDSGYSLTAMEDQGFAFYDRGANRMTLENSKEHCDFIALAGGYAVIGNRNEPSVRIMKLEDDEESLIMSYDARYPHDEARISQDGRTVMLFDYQSFRIYNMNSQMLNQTVLPDPDYIYDQQFIKSGNDSWLEVIWYDGTTRTYSAADGSLISEVADEPPSTDLYEEFYTDDYRFTSSLHGVPEVYDIKTNQLVSVLEKDSYLTYVTQVGDYIITEYISAAGARYGLLLDDKLQTLAYLPGLCDISDGKLVFDYESGNLRQCRLYSLQELKALGETYIK